MKIREIIGTDLYGTTVKGVVDGLEKLHFHVKAGRLGIEDFQKEVRLPAIAQIKTKEGLNHFVVIHKVKKEIFHIADPAQGSLKLSKDDFEEIYQGVLILMAPTSDFERMSLKGKGMFELFCQLILPQKKLLLTVILASFLLTALGVLGSTFSAVLMDQIIPYQLRRQLFFFLIVYGLVGIIQNVLGAFKNQILLFLARKVDIPLMLGYYDHILHLPYEFFASRKVGDIITRFQDAMTIKDIFTSVSISLVMDISLSVIMAIALFNLNARLFLILLGMVIINVILIYVFKKPYKKLNYEQMESGAVLNSHLIESLQNMETVKSQNDEKYFIQKLEERIVNLQKIGYREGTLQNTQGIISEAINSLGGLIFMGIGALQVIDGYMSIGQLLVFQTLSGFFTDPIQNLVGLQMTFQEASVAMKRLSELMSLDREDVVKENQIKDVNLQGDIQFKHVKFAYGSRPPVIEGFDLTIPVGKKVAIVGESGAGKSTLAKLLMKFSKPTDGKIIYSGYDIEDLDQSYLRNQTAYIPQNIQLFTGTIIDNLKVGNPTATYEEMVSACRQAGADGFIERLPGRYQAYVEEGGSNFSGGEKQRLVIARALLSNPQLFIFDEATSHLDSFSEQKLHDLIFKKMSGKTALIIAHRLSTITACDIICFMERGQIVEQGTHDELVTLGGKYARMIGLQQVEVNPPVESFTSLVQDEVSYL